MLDREAQRLAASDPNRGTFAIEQLMAGPKPVHAPERLRLKQGKQELCETLVQPGQLLDIEAIYNGRPMLLVRLRTEGTPPQTLYDGPLRARGKLIWTLTDGRTGALPLAFDPGFKEAIALAALDAEHGRDVALGWSLALLTAALLMLLGIFGLAEPTRLRGFTGLPPRRYTLPVSTGSLVLHPVLVGAAAVVIFFTCWSWIVRPLVVASGRSPADVYLLALLAAGLVWFQALVWGLPSFPKLRACLLTILVLSGLVLASFPVAGRNGAGMPQFELLKQILTPAFACAWVLGVAAAWIGVGVPMLWGMWMTLQKAALLFR